MSDRLEWIKRRNAAGFDWSGAVEAMAQVKVDHTRIGVVLDTSAINEGGEHFPRTALIVPYGGEWLHPESGACGPLVELLWTMTIAAIVDVFNPETHDVYWGSNSMRDIALMLDPKVQVSRNGEWVHLDDGGVQRTVPAWWLQACVPDQRRAESEREDG